MKYEAEVDLRNANTSHALLATFVGCGRRVLDVGCANGSLGRVLSQRGCRVAGVEPDPEAAEAAGNVLDTVLIGEIEDLDLVGHFGKESFDVVVFGDVLEHLVDPAAALKKVRPLLGEGGFVVASVPNVAHGSVRLSLLNGRFDYRPLGLLDSTHIRFFTRESLHELFVEAGFAPVDVRRTTAGVFDTEVKIRREDFEPSVIDAVEGDPESTTYQFVLKAVPEEEPEAAGSASAPVRSATAQGTPRIGIFAEWEADDLCRALLVRVTTAELARRLRRSAIRSFSSSERFRPSPHDGGLHVEPLGAWSDERARRLRTELDCVVIVGDLPAGGDTEDDAADPARFLLDGPGPESDPECPTVWSAVRLEDGPIPSLDGILANPPYRALVEGVDAPADGARDGSAVAVPDPLLLLPRLLRPEALTRRLEFVKMMGWFPRYGPAVVVEMDGGLLSHAHDVAKALDTIVATGDMSVVLIQTQPGGAGSREAAEAVSAAMVTAAYRLPGDALVDDVVAVIANADMFAASSAPALMLGLAYERPLAHVELSGDASSSPLTHLTGESSAVIIRPADLADLPQRELFRATPAAIAPKQARLDAHFDRVAAIADGAASLRPRSPDDPAALPPPEYVAAISLAHRRMRERLEAERRAVADHLREVHAEHESELARLDAEIAALRTDREPLEARLSEALEENNRQGQSLTEQQDRFDAVAAELEALKGIRVLRLLRPARAVYARLRGSRL